MFELRASAAGRDAGATLASVGHGADHDWVACRVQFERDPDAFGVNTVPNPPARSERASAASTSCSEIDDTASEASGSFAMRRRNSRRRKSGRFLGPAGPRTRTQQIALAAVATGLIVAFGGRARRKH